MLLPVGVPFSVILVSSQQHWLRSPAPLDTQIEAPPASRRQPLLLRGLVPSSRGSSNLLGSDTFRIFLLLPAQRVAAFFPDIYYLCITCLFLQLTLVAPLTLVTPKSSVKMILIKYLVWNLFSWLNPSECFFYYISLARSHPGSSNLR